MGSRITRIALPNNAKVVDLIDPVYPLCFLVYFAEYFSLTLITKAMESPIKPPNPKIYIDPNASSPKLKKHSLRLNSYPIIPTIMVTHTYKMPILPITLETAIDMAIAALIHPSILL